MDGKQSSSTTGLGFDAAIFDLDGVVTKTARIHSRAWEQTFNEYLDARRNRGDSGNLEPFRAPRDYLEFIDGKPRYDGAQSFLNSRQIEIPRGNPEDEPGTESVCGLGNRKNEYFREILDREGPDVFESTVHVIQDLRKRGVSTALVSSSKNAGAVLRAAKLEGLFDAKVDGNDTEARGLKGKPEPDAFEEAARLLHADPAKSIVVEDAVSGVEAGRRGSFGLVVGIPRSGSREELLSHGADIVVDDLADLPIPKILLAPLHDSSSLPDARQKFAEIWEELGRKALLVCLDYDGTLTPIVRNPGDAVLDDNMRDALRSLVGKCQVAIVSGRDAVDVQKRVDIPEFCYAGSHGFEILGPDCSQLSTSVGEEYLSALSSMERELMEKVDGLRGASVERKRFSVAVHYRKVEEEDLPRLKEAVKTVEAHHSRFRRSEGKKLIEFHPAIEWDKGKAVERLLEQIRGTRGNGVPLYIGDDTTDEDAFRAVYGEGIGVYVRTEPRRTLAKYTLEDIGDVAEFLRALGNALAEKGSA